ncbi:MAG: VanW family protein [Nitriliruptoraceae bacterium]
MPLRRIGAIAAISVAGLAVAVTATLAVIVILQWDRVLPNTSVGGVDVSSAYEHELRATLQSVANDHRDTSLVLSFESQEFTFSPADADWTLDISATVDAAFARGRSHFLSSTMTRFASYFVAHDVAPIETWDKAKVAAWVKDVAATVDRPAFHGNIVIDSTSLSVEVHEPHGSATVDQGATTTILVGTLTRVATEDSRRQLPVDTTPILVDPAAFAGVGRDIERAISGPMQFDLADGVFTVTPQQIAEMIIVERTPDGDQQHVDIAVTPGTVQRVIDLATQAAFAMEPVNAEFDLERAPPVTFDAQGSAVFEPIEVEVPVVPGRAGAQFDRHLFADQMTSMLRTGLRRNPLALDLTEPYLPTEVASELGPTHLLGTFTTYHEAGQTRVHNIQLLADTIDGTVIRPGDQFSINEISGRRTCEKGYFPAGTIVRGVLVDTCGGGTSQFGTTTFNAAFFAGVQLDQWRAHSWYISRYPMGREATLSYPELDVKFTNDTDALILVRTSYTPSSITVSIYGRPLATQVEALLGNATNPRPPTTQVRWTDELFEGQERVVQSAGSNGFTVRVVRAVERLDGSSSTDTIDTVYQPQHRVVERGTRPRPD